MRMKQLCEPFVAVSRLTSCAACLPACLSDCQPDNVIVLCKYSDCAE